MSKDFLKFSHLCDSNENTLSCAAEEKRVVWGGWWWGEWRWRAYAYSDNRQHWRRRWLPNPPVSMTLIILYNVLYTCYRRRPRPLWNFILFYFLLLLSFTWCCQHAGGRDAFYCFKTFFYGSIFLTYRHRHHHHQAGRCAHNKAKVCGTKLNWNWSSSCRWSCTTPAACLGMKMMTSKCIQMSF